MQYNAQKSTELQYTAVDCKLLSSRAMWCGGMGCDGMRCDGLFVAAVKMWPGH
jgi:hypothetical protein